MNMRPLLGPAFLSLDKSLSLCYPTCMALNTNYPRFSTKFLSQLREAECQTNLFPLLNLADHSSGLEKSRALLSLAQEIAYRAKDRRQVEAVLRQARLHAADEYWMLRRIRSIRITLLRQLQ